MSCLKDGSTEKKKIILIHLAEFVYTTKSKGTVLLNV